MRNYKNNTLLIEITIDRERKELKMQNTDNLTFDPICESEGIVRELNSELANDVSRHYNIDLNDYNVSVVNEEPVVMGL